MRERAFFPRMPHTISANIFSLLATLAAAFQLALVAGAPWGALTQGGRVSGALPAYARVIATISALVLVAFIYIVRTKAGLRPRTRSPRFPRLIWFVVAYCALGIAANAVTPSAAERALWLPVVSVMFATSLHVARRQAAPLT